MAIKAVIFDLDGVLYRGDTVIDGAIEAVSKTRAVGKKVFFLTNAGTMSRAGRTQQLRAFGFEVEEKEVYTSSYGVAYYISKSKKNPTAYCLGEGGLKEELSSFGIFLTQEKPNFVVVSLDRGITYARLSTAFRNIMNGSKFLATNGDATFPVEDGLLPGAGSIVNSLAYATKVDPYIIGKPNTYLLEMILENCECTREEILLIGDKVESDIALAKKAKIKSALVLTGVSKREDLDKLKAGEKPDYVASSVKDLLPVIFSSRR